MHWCAHIEAMNYLVVVDDVLSCKDMTQSNHAHVMCLMWCLDSVFLTDKILFLSGCNPKEEQCPLNRNLACFRQQYFGLCLAGSEILS